ncbi:MAG: hypothetical protein CVV44_06020 [Spirochaetae bacterium HGW-Spirochaetae-1]|jgi:TldD protein|nr:MAG: hypothetical protein CVV44_06020 [Spirochaetae bacterium HGW-Spirochaetae-1]
MKRDPQDLLQTGRDALSGLSCEYAEIRISCGSGTSISLSGDDIDSFSTGESIGGSVRVLKDGAWGFVSFNDFSEIKRFARRAMELALQIAGSEKSSVAPYGPVRRRFSTGAGKNINDISIDEKFQLIRSYNNILKSSPDIQTTRAIYRDTVSQYILLNTEGSEIIYNRSYCGVSLSSIARSGSVIQPFHNSISGYGGYEIVEDREEIAEEVVRTAVDLLKAEAAPGGTCAVIVDPKLAGVFIHEAFGHLSEADFIHENEEMRRVMVLGRQFGPEGLNVYDDGSLAHLPGYTPFDDEGVLPEKTALISGGMLTGRLHSRETAARMNENPTGNGRAINVMRQPIVRMTNTYIDKGPYSKEDIFSAVDRGIYAIDVIGGQTNLEMFTFTSGFGFEIKNGKRGKMYRDIQLSGNVFQTLKNIKMIGNDLQMFGGLGGCGKGGQSPLPVSFGGPHMLIEEVLIGGKQ